MPDAVADKDTAKLKAVEAKKDTDNAQAADKKAVATSAPDKKPKCERKNCTSAHEVFEAVSGDDKKEVFKLDSCDLGSWS